MRELVILLGLYGLYSLSRMVIRGDASSAKDHASAVLRVEQAWGLDIELTLTHWLHQSLPLSIVAAFVYATLHYTVTPTVLVMLYRKRPKDYSRERLVLVVATAIALVCYWLYPVAPPRLLSSSYPDVLALTSHWGWWGAEASAPRGLGGFTNQNAALPSMHVGWAVWCAWVIWRSTARRAVRTLAAAYPVLVTLVVVATSNHYVVDAVLGALIVLLAIRMVGVRRAGRARRAQVGDAQSVVYRLHELAPTRPSDISQTSSAGGDDVVNVGAA